MKKNKILAISISCIMAAAVFTGCGKTDNETASKTDTITAAGHLYLSVNPEIKISYNNDGLVTKIIGVNGDGKDIVSDYDNYIGKECREVVSELVEEIHEAGYFVEEVEGEQKKIVIELEEGSKLPDDDFLDKISDDVSKTVAGLDLGSDIVVRDDDIVSDYGTSDYDTTESTTDGNSDYDTNDGNTDYDDTDYDSDDDVIEIPVTPSGESDYGTSDYDTDDSNSDYGASDYETDDSNSNYGASDYDTDDSNSDYGASDYDTDDSNSDYGSSDYDDGESDYKPVQTAPPATQAPAVNGNSDYGNSDYGNSDYGNSDYGSSDYGNSDYDD